MAIRVSGVDRLCLSWLLWQQSVVVLYSRHLPKH